MVISSMSMVSRPTMSRGIRTTTFIADSPADDFHYIAVDVETSGSTASDELLAVGVAVVRQSDAKPVSSLLVMLMDVHDVSTKPATWCGTTWFEFWNNPAKRSDGRTPIAALVAVRDVIGVSTPRDGVDAIIKFLRTAMHPDAVKDWVVTSDNVAFDIGWIDRLCRLFHYPPVAELSGRHRSPFDLSNFNAGVARSPPSMRRGKSYTLACDALGVPEAERQLAGVEHDHLPDNDALVNAHRAAVVARAIALASPAQKRKEGDWDCPKCFKCATKCVVPSEAP